MQAWSLAVASGDVDRIRELVAEGHSPDQPIDSSGAAAGSAGLTGLNLGGPHGGPPMHMHHAAGAMPLFMLLCCLLCCMGCRRRSERELRLLPSSGGPHARPTVRQAAASVRDGQLALFVFSLVPKMDPILVPKAPHNHPMR